MTLLNVAVTSWRAQWAAAVGKGWVALHASTQNSSDRQSSAAVPKPKRRIHVRRGGDRPHSELMVHALRPRHRRKPGSGPPANALIAWIGTDPYLRQAGTLTSHRRHFGLPPGAHTRATAAVATCLVLTCGAVIGISEIINHGRAPGRHPIATPSFPRPAERRSPPVTDPGPAAMVPMLMDAVTLPPTTPKRPVGTSRQPASTAEPGSNH